MDVNNSERVSDFKKKYFEHAKKSDLYENILKTNGKIVFGKGSDNPRVVFIGEAPGQSENIQGRPFVRRSGKILDKWIDELGVREESAVLNVVPIIPLNDGKIRKPTDIEINYFLPYTEEMLRLLKPEVIVLLGRSAASIFDKTLSVGEIKRWDKSRLYFIYHPAYYLRRGQNGISDLAKLKDLLNANQKNLGEF